MASLITHFRFYFCVFAIGISNASHALNIDDIVSARNQGNLDAAEEMAQQLLSEAKSSGNVSLQADAVFQIGRNAMERNNYPSAQQSLSQALSLYQNLGNQSALASTYRQLGLIFRYQSNYSAALEYLYMALAIFQQQGLTREIASVHNSLGIVLEKMGQFTKAARYHQLALETNYQLDDTSGIASALYNLADIRRVMGDLTLALDYFEQALALDEASTNKKNIAYSRYKIGFVNMQMGNFSIARENMQVAYTLFMEIGAKRDEDWALSGLAELDFKEGNIEMALERATAIMERAKANNYNSLLMDIYLLLIDIQLYNKAYSVVEALIEKALTLARTLEEASKISQLLASKVQVHEQLNELAAAYTSLKQQKALDDSLLDKKRVDAIASIQAQTEFVRRENEITLLKQQQALENVQEEKEREQQLFIVIAGVAVLLLGFLVYSRVAQSRYTRKLEHEVKKRTVELQIANTELAELSLTDNLTGLKNRRFLEHQIENQVLKAFHKSAMSAGKREPREQTVLCLFVIDIDNFKSINDTYGHVAGDSVLKQTAERLQQVMRASDYLVRWGGEEFVVAADFSDRLMAADLADRIIQGMRGETFFVDDNNRETITCSVGFSCFSYQADLPSDNRMSTLFGIADNCLYAAKAAGRNRWVGITELNQPVSAQLPNTVEALEALDKQGALTLALSKT